MAIPHLPGPSRYDNNFDVEEFLERLDPYIVALVRTKIPRNIGYSFSDEMEDIAQKVRIKLWLTLEKKPINNPRAYIKCIVYTEVVDLIRHHRSTLPLPLDEDGELYHGNLLFAPSEGMQDPVSEIEQAEELDNLTQGTFEAIIQLPPRQQEAVICSLKDQIDEVLPVFDALRDQSIDVEAINWPEEKDKLQSLRASLSIARKKLQSIRRRYR